LLYFAGGRRDVQYYLKYTYLPVGVWTPYSVCGRIFSMNLIKMHNNSFKAPGGLVVEFLWQHNNHHGYNIVVTRNECRLLFDHWQCYGSIYFLYRNRTYTSIKVIHLSWKQANTFCSSIGAMLPEFRSREEMQETIALLDFINDKRLAIFGFFIGLKINKVF